MNSSAGPSFCFVSGLEKVRTPTRTLQGWGKRKRGKIIVFRGVGLREWSVVRARGGTVALLHPSKWWLTADWHMAHQGDKREADEKAVKWCRGLEAQLCWRRLICGYNETVVQRCISVACDMNRFIGKKIGPCEPVQ